MHELIIAHNRFDVIGRNHIPHNSLPPLSFKPQEAKFRVMLVGGAHRIQAVALCKKDWEKYKQNEGTELAWDESVYSVGREPAWLLEIPASLHYLGGDLEEHQNRSIAMGQALNDLSGAVNTANYGDVMYFVDTMMRQESNVA